MIGFINGAIESIANFFNLILSFLPKSPFHYLDSSGIKEFLSYLNWFIPVDNLIVIGELWLSSIAVFYIYSIALRWVKAID